jgi:hypothetical protein
LNIDLQQCSTMTKIQFHSTLGERWVRVEPVRLGRVTVGLGTPDQFITLDSVEVPLLRVDLYRPSDESFSFEDALLWSHFLAIGWGHHVYLVNLRTRQVLTTQLGSYFSHLYPTSGCLLVASAERLLCIASDGTTLWHSSELVIDGVIVDRVDEGVVRGQGEWDPPGGWRPYSVSLQTGEAV